jgi:hypothetical protein
MMRERKIVVSLSEIKALIFECTNCKARTVLSPENADLIPDQCAKGHLWGWKAQKDFGHYEAATPYPAFLGSLKRLRNPDSQQPGFSIFLEFDDSEVL